MARAMKPNQSKRRCSCRWVSSMNSHMPTPMTTGSTAIRIGRGRRSWLDGGFGSTNLVWRSGGSSRGGRLKSMPVPSCDGCSAASGGSYGARPSSVAPIAICWPGSHCTAAVSGPLSMVAWTPSKGTTIVPPRGSTLTRSANSGTGWSATMIVAACPLPMSASPRLSLCTAPAPGPPVTLTSTSPVGSGRTHPSGEPRLTTEPSRTAEAASVSPGSSCWKSMYRGTDCCRGAPYGCAIASDPCERGPGKRRTRPLSLEPGPPSSCRGPSPPAPVPEAAVSGMNPPLASRSSSFARSATGVSGSASRTMSAHCRAAGDTTVSASRMITSQLFCRQTWRSRGPGRSGHVPGGRYQPSATS